MQSNFQFLEEEFPILFNLGQSAEYSLHQDPVVCLIKLRQFGEHATALIFEHYGLEFPLTDNFHSRLKLLEFERVLPGTIRDLFFNVKEKGNVAVHQMKGSVEDGRHALFSAFKLSKWFYETFSVKNAELSAVKFHVPQDLDARHALKELENQYKELEAQLQAVLAEREVNTVTEASKQATQERSTRAAKKIEMSEAETRELIDAQLRLAGWETDTPTLNFKLHKTKPERNRKMAIAEWPVPGGWADYALFIGFELYGIVEAKRYGQDISTDLRQSKNLCRSG